MTKTGAKKTKGRTIAEGGDVVQKRLPGRTGEGMGIVVAEGEGMAGMGRTGAEASARGTASPDFWALLVRRPLGAGLGT